MKTLPQENSDKEVFMNLRRSICAASVFLLAFTIVCAAQEVILDKVPMKHVAAYSGKGMYANYCAVCHGTNGTGDGPAAKALKIAPANLTILAKQNNGKFPALHVYTVIRGDSNDLTAHGAKDMPLWGALFAESSTAIPPDADVHQRISNLTRYVASLQKN
jgi:mono/diheme cytochrome c family protein